MISDYLNNKRVCKAALKNISICFSLHLFSDRPCQDCIWLEVEKLRAGNGNLQVNLILSLQYYAGEETHLSPNKLMLIIIKTNSS